MNCEQFGKFLDEYENLSAIQKAELIEHTKSCDACRKEYELFMSMLDATKSFPPIKVDDSFLQNLNARIDKEVVNAPVRKNVWEHLKLNAHRYSAAAACLALLAVIGVNNSDLLNRLMNPYQDQDIVPIVSTEPQSEEDNSPTGLIITSTIKPSQTSTPSASPVPTPASTPGASTSNVSTRTVTVTQTPVRSGSIVAPNPTAEPQIQQIPVASVAPVASATPNADTPVSTPIPTSTQNTDEQNYVMPASEYELPQRSGTDTQDTGFSSEYNFEDTSNYLKVSVADIERVKGLISEYSKDSQGDVYLMAKEDVSKLLAILSDEGIEFDNSLGGIVDGNIAFKLIIS